MDCNSNKFSFNVLTEVLLNMMPLSMLEGQPRICSAALVLCTFVLCGSATKVGLGWPHTRYPSLPPAYHLGKRQLADDTGDFNWSSVSILRVLLNFMDASIPMLRYNPPRSSSGHRATQLSEPSNAQDFRYVRLFFLSCTIFLSSNFRRFQWITVTPAGDKLQ